MKNILIKVLYGEASKEEEAKLKQEIESDFELQEEMEQLKKAKEMLDSAKKSPHTSSIKIILKHSRKKCPEHSL